jgi:hypothetical protein
MHQMRQRCHGIDGFEWRWMDLEQLDLLLFPMAMVFLRTGLQTSSIDSVLVRWRNAILPDPCSHKGNNATTV